MTAMLAATLQTTACAERDLSLEGGADDSAGGGADDDEETGGGSTADDDSGDGGATNGDGDGDGDGDVGCHDVNANDFTEVLELYVNFCGLEGPCPDVSFSDDSCILPVDYDPLAGQCVIDALSKETVGSYVVEDCPNGIFTQQIFMELRGDGSVLYSSATSADLSSSYRQTRRALPDVAYFEACRAETPEDLMGCVEGILEMECLPEPETCP